MWPALANGLPFFFSDTTSYVRAGDMVAGIASHGHVHTIWSRVTPDPAPATAPPPPIGPQAAPAPAPARGNDVATGTIMAGRSPYFGLVLWLTYVTSNFWLFVLAQALISWWLIGLSLRVFGVDDLRERIATAAILSIATPLAIYNSILLADALAAFGILSYLLLAAGHRRFSLAERIGLVLLIIASVTSHLTHIVMLMTMTAVLLVALAVRRFPWSQIKAPILLGLAMVVIGLGSVMVTSAAIKAHFGKPPALVPLLTARLIADGPGRSYIESGCAQHRFAVCRIPYRGWTSSTEFLWSTDPRGGAYLLADAPTRQAMAAEDKAFATAVLLHAPVATISGMAWDTILQLTNFEDDMLGQGCYADMACAGAQFPEAIRAQIANTRGGHTGWPMMPLTLTHYFTVIAAIFLLIALTRRLPDEQRRLLLLWIVLLGVAMLANAFFGGAISEPQSRYQARIVWLIPLLALIAALVYRRAHLLGRSA